MTGSLHVGAMRRRPTVQRTWRNSDVHHATEFEIRGALPAREVLFQLPEGARMRFLHWIGVLAVAASLGACASGTPRAGARAVEVSTELGLPDTTTVSGAYSGESEYRLGPQDLLEINVFQVQELNRTVRVNSSGDISLPLDGVLRAGGLTVRELEESIGAALSKDYLQDPQVSVFVKEYTSQRVTLEGAVKKPGIYPLSGRTTLLQAIATGGGLDPLANLQGVVVFRTVDGKKMAAVFD